MEVEYAIPEKMDQAVISGNGWYPQFMIEPSNSEFYEIFKDTDRKG